MPEEGAIYAIARDVTDRELLERKMELLLRSDPLTGVFNRRRFDETLEAQLAHARRYRKDGALLIVDVDHFKQINDEFGYAPATKCCAPWRACLLRTCARPTR